MLAVLTAEPTAMPRSVIFRTQFGPGYMAVFVFWSLSAFTISAQEECPHPPQLTPSGMCPSTPIKRVASLTLTCSPLIRKKSIFNSVPCFIICLASFSCSLSGSTSILIESSPTAFGAVRAERAIRPATDLTAADSIVILVCYQVRSKNERIYKAGSIHAIGRGNLRQISLVPSMVNFQEQYGVPGWDCGGHDRHWVTIRESMVRANTGNSIRPTDLQGNRGNPFLSRADCTLQVLVVTIRVFLSGRRISRVLRKETSLFFKAISSASSPPFSGRESRSFIRPASIEANCSQTNLSRSRAASIP